jgi:hypothetical protein
MKTRKEIFNFLNDFWAETELGPCAQRARPTAARPQCRTGRGSAAHYRPGRPQDAARVRAQHVLRVGEQLRALVKLWGLRMRREVGVRWLGTNEVVENRGECGGDSLPKGDTAWVRMRCRGGLFS